MSKAAEESVRARTGPIAEQRVEIRIGQIKTKRKTIKPPQPNTEWDEVGPKVAHIVVLHKEVPETFRHRGVGFSISVNNVGLFVNGWDLAAMVES